MGGGNSPLGKLVQNQFKTLLQLLDGVRRNDPGGQRGGRLVQEAGRFIVLIPVDLAARRVRRMTVNIGQFKGPAVHQALVACIRKNKHRVMRSRLIQFPAGDMPFLRQFGIVKISTPHPNAGSKFIRPLSDHPENIPDALNRRLATVDFCYQ